MAILVLIMNQIVTKESFGADEEKIILEGGLDKYVNYDLSSGENGTLVQYSLKTGIEYGEIYYPVKNTQIAINLNQIDGKFPYDVKVIEKSTKVTNGQTTNIEEDYSYDSNNGTLTINVSNENENGEAINTTQISPEDRDEYILICYYDTYTRRTTRKRSIL